MLKQHKLMKNFTTEYLLLVDQLLNADDEIYTIQTSYARFIGIADTTLKVVNYHNRKSIYNHLSRANGLYNTWINDYYERLQGLHFMEIGD